MEIVSLRCLCFRSEETEAEKDEAIDVVQAVNDMAHAGNLEVTHHTYFFATATIFNISIKSTLEY